MSAFLFINSRELKNLYRFKMNKALEPLVNTVCKALILNHNDDDSDNDDDDNKDNGFNFDANTPSPPLASSSLPFNDIILNKETGINARSFHGNVNVARHKHYQSILMLVYNNLKKPPLIFPNRVTPYRNHFCVYTGLDDSVIIVRSETTLRYQDHDAVLQYDVLKLSDNALTTTCRKRWIISYDTCVSSTTQCPSNFLNYVLCCSGEWWFFDRGIILNGTQDRHSLLIYYELHAKYQFKRRETIGSSSFPNLSNGNTTGPTSSSLSSLLDSRAKLPKFAQLISENLDLVNDDAIAAADGNRQRSMTTTSNDTTNGTLNTHDAVVVVNVADRQIDATTNDDKRRNTNVSEESPSSSSSYSDFEAIPVPRPRLSTLLPSSWWFIERDKELQKGDISYFIPTS